MGCKGAVGWDGMVRGFEVRGDGRGGWGCVRGGAGCVDRVGVVDLLINDLSVCV